MTSTIPRPTLVVHADWSSRPAGRWVARATREVDGRYTAHAPEPVPDPATWLRELAAAAANGAVLAGLDLPIGLPAAYAARAGIDDFVAWLPAAGHGEWAAFYQVAETAAEIGLRRPFYPQRPGGARRQHLVDGLGLPSPAALYRRCDRGGCRPPAAPLFWTLGAQQVGKAATHGWQSLLAPSLADPALDAAIWPFAGPLATLLAPGRLVWVETYPAECYRHLGVTFSPAVGGKRSPAARRAAGRVLQAWAAQAGVRLSPALAATIGAGFGPGPAGEDPFDAVVGLMGMLNVVLGRRAAAPELPTAVRQIEGWILGQLELAAVGADD